MSRYTQDGYNIKGPGLPEQGVVAVGPEELESAFEAGMDSHPYGKGPCKMCGEGLMLVTNPLKR